MPEDYWDYWTTKHTAYHRPGVHNPDCPYCSGTPARTITFYVSTQEQHDWAVRLSWSQAMTSHLLDGSSVVVTAAS